MSIGPECLSAESRRILRPGTLAVTNVRLDHLDDMGRDRAAIARTLASAVPGRGRRVRPGGGDPRRLRGRGPERRGEAPSGRARRAGRGNGRREPPGGRRSGNSSPTSAWPGPSSAPWVSTGRPPTGAWRGAAPDPGSLRIRRGLFGRPPRPATCVSLFAANEPESSAAALAEVLGRLPRSGRPLVGLLAPEGGPGRPDAPMGPRRGRRLLPGFRGRRPRRAAGPAGPAAAPPREAAGRDRFFRGRRGLARSASWTASWPAVAGEPVVVGLGNFVGPGESLVRHWEREGTRP